MSRRSAAKLLGIHEDTATKRLAFGLAGAVTVWGGRGKEHVFSRLMLARYFHASRCQCFMCRWTLEDMAAVAQHLMRARHSVFEGCDVCGDGYPGAICLPCGG